MNLDHLDLGRLAWLARTENLTGGSIQRLFESFGNLAQIFTADGEQLEMHGASPNQIQRFLKMRSEANPELEYDLIYNESQTTLTWLDPTYPAAFHQLSDPPPILFLRGKPQALATPLPIAIVGTRDRTSYGTTCANTLAATLAQHGATIVSGLALGIDGDAHQATLNAGGQTIAILGTGIDDKTLYPSSHLKLAHQIISGQGLVMSEYPPLSDRRSYRFPHRNRLVATLSKLIIIIEAPDHSGALITGRLAAELGRDVLVVPGPVTSPTSVGTNRLIAEGASLILSSTTPLEHLNITIDPNKVTPFFQEDSKIIPITKKSQPTKPTNTIKPPPDLSELSQLEKQIYELHINQHLPIDLVIEKTSLPASQILTAISMLELKGLLN